VGRIGRLLLADTAELGESVGHGDVPCVEVAFLSGRRLVRDSKLGDASPLLAVGPAEWSTFTAGVKAGRLDS
jgi:hypothetical protein